MTVKEFYEYMCEKLPIEWALDGDFDGMSCCPDPEREVKNVLIALDATSDIVDEAVNEGYDVILTHHPMLFGGIDGVVAGNYRSDKLIKLIRAGISVMSFHTRLDAAEGGVNDMLASLLNLKNVERFGEKGIGRVGELECPMFAEDFAMIVKDTLVAPFAEYSDCGKMIKKVAVCGGSAGSLIGDAIAVGADALVGGEFKYHDMTDSADYGISLIAAGHFYTENPVCAKLFELASEAGEDIIPTISFSNKTGAV